MTTWLKTLTISAIVIFYNPQAANAFPRDVDQGADFSSFAVYQTGDSYHTVSGTGPAGGTVGNRCFVHFTADAEL